ncbi:hypothetical protein [Aquirufa sp. OSTEICH-129A]
MKKLCITFVYILVYTQLSARTLYLEWFNLDEKQFERINLSTFFLDKQNNNGEWIPIHKLTFSNILLSDFPTNLNPITFNYRGKLLISIPGTGQVYIFDKIHKQFTRIDETYYRGYNFNALQFIRNDTLFSLGGTGFWRSNSILTYFDFSNQEWEIMDNGQNHPSFGITSERSGLMSNQNQILAIANKEGQEINDHKTNSLYLFSILHQSWNKLGNIDFETFHSLGITSTKFKLLGDFLFFSEPYKGYLGNPKTNEILKYVGKKKLFFNSNATLYYKNGMVYSVTKKFSKSFESIKVDSLPIKEILSNSKLVSELYSPPKNKVASILLYLVGGILLVILVIKLFSRITLLKEKFKGYFFPKKQLQLPKGAYRFLLFFKENGADTFITTDEFSDLLQLSKKAYDTQRQYRSQFICILNNFFCEFAEINEAIYRINMEDDKRFIKYGIKKEALDFAIKNKLV